jgi:hypothetical protein
MAKTTDTASGDDAKTQQRNWESFGNLIRMAERLATLQHPVDEAHAWAEGTLSKAGLPTVPGLYALGADGGLTLVVPRQGAAFLCADFDAGHEWQLPLHEAILKLDRGYDPVSPEYLAARLLEERMFLQGAYDARDPDQIAARACMIGRLHVLGQDRKLAEARAKQRAGGKSSAEARGKYPDLLKGRWVFRYNELKRKYEEEGKEKTQTELADEVARDFRVPKMTVRKLLPRLLDARPGKKRGRPKKRSG